MRRFRHPLSLLVIIFYLLLFGSLAIYFGFISQSSGLSTIETSTLPPGQTQNGATSFYLALLIAAILSIVITMFHHKVSSRSQTRQIRKLYHTLKNSRLEDVNLESFQADQEEIRQLTETIQSVIDASQKQIVTLERENRRLLEIIDHVMDGVLIIGTSGELLFINLAVERFFDIDKTSKIGESLAKVTRHHQIVKLWRQTRADGTSKIDVLELPAKRLTIQVICTPFDDYYPGSTIILIKDITRIHHLETVRKDFISNISHELRTPLASLKALTETLMDGALEDSSVSRHFLTKIDTEVDSLTLMVQELLELSRIESGKVPIQMEPHSAEELISPAVDRLRLQAERNGLTLRVDIEPGIPQVSADLVRLQQVIVNLVHNAIKFTPPGGEITVSAKHRDNSIVFAIQDTGIGIAQHDIPRIFERFYKADRSRSGGGTGLGLAIAKHLVEAHSGRIWVESQEDKGSIFYFSLPGIVSV
jgi:two-component system phosphate regulon sensor histidine kinase PhoR